jgi:DNA-binding transcriptional LysR family regulator
MIHLAEKAGFRLRIAREIDAKETVLALVGRGLGVSLTPESAAGVGNDRVRYVPIRDPQIIVDIALIWIREKMSPLVRRFIDSAAHLGQQIEAERSARLVA